MLRNGASQMLRRAFGNNDLRLQSLLCVGIRCISVIQKSIIKGEKMKKKTIGFDKRILFYICAVMVILQVLVMGVGYGISDKIVGNEQREKIVAEMQIYANGLDS